jgi:hypothetical protein
MLRSIAIYLESDNGCSVEFDSCPAYSLSGSGRALLEHTARVVVEHRLAEEKLLSEKNKAAAAVTF